MSANDPKRIFNPPLFPVLIWADSIREWPLAGRIIMRFISLTACLCAAVVLQSSALAQAPAAIRIGILNDQAGPYADFGGKTSVTAAQMAVEDFGGKVLGKPVEIVVGDHQNKPDLAANIARRWFDLENVSAIAELTNSA